MCGIVGFSGAKNSESLKKMTDAIFHRGPDDEAFLERDRFSVGFRRLAIIGLHLGFTTQTKLSALWRIKDKHVQECDATNVS